MQVLFCVMYRNKAMQSIVVTLFGMLTSYIQKFDPCHFGMIHTTLINNAFANRRRESYMKANETIKVFTMTLGTNIDFWVIVPIDMWLVFK